ncbi:MAG: hypothetical protein OQK82_08075 [Candidatus Pacearchaeota archaeon]|nr:hypothetical protein [Candidatus Pacearchaeota archaeon]
MMKFEKIDVGEKKKFILKNGMIFTVKITDIEKNLETLYGIDKFNEEIILSADSISAIVPLSGTHY